MLPTLVVALAAAQTAQQGEVRVMPAPLEPPLTCPKYQWSFPFGCEGLATLADQIPEPRFRVFAQSTADLVRAQDVCRFLLTLHSMTYARLRLDHQMAYEKMVDVFLCEGGRAGGEQGVFEGRYMGLTRKFNAIYIYHLDSFTANPLQMVRELAHEYGHAVLPNVGGFQTPEEWANGFLGERLFLLWCWEDAKRNRLKPKDLLGADLQALRKWVEANVYPLADRIWLNGANQAALNATGPRALDEYTGLIVYAWEAFPGALGRALKLAGGDRAKDALRGLALAVEEIGEWEVRIPERLKDKGVWLPLGRNWRVDGGSITGRSGEWVRINSSGGTVRVSSEN